MSEHGECQSHRGRDPAQPPEVTNNLLPADYLELRQSQQSFSDVAAYLSLSTVNLTIDRTPLRPCDILAAIDAAR